MLGIVIATTFISLLILRRRVFLSYFLYTIVILLFLMHSDGVTFQYLWPNAPKLNNYFSIIIGLAFSIVPYDFAREFLRTRLFHPRWDKFMAFMIQFRLGRLLAYWPPSRVLKKFAFTC